MVSTSVGRPAGVRTASLALLAILLASAGVFWLLQRWPDTGAALATPVPPVVMTVPPGSDSTDAPVTVSVTVARPAPLVASGISGVVTAVTLSPSEVLGQGDEVLEVDGRPVRAAATVKPFYGVVKLGDSGEDVTALRSLLGEVGIEVAASGEADEALRTAVGSWLGPQATGVVLDPAQVMWLPTPGLVVEAVAATVAAPAPAAGSPVVTFAPVVKSATIPPRRFAAHAASFTVTVADRSVPVDASAALTLSRQDARALAAMVARPPSGPPTPNSGPSADGATVSEVPGTVTTTWDSPVAAIPTSAIITRQDGTLCVVVAPQGATRHGVTVTVTASKTSTGTSQASGLAAGASLVVNPVASATAAACTG